MSSDIMQYKSYRIVDGKSIWVIVDENGKVIHKEPSKEELKYLERESFSRKKLYTNKGYLLRRLRYFYEENGRIPEEKDLVGNHKYPSFGTYQNIFGSWNDAIRHAELWEKRYNLTNSCDRCGRDFGEIDRLGDHPVKEYDKKGNWNGKWDCKKCHSKYDLNSIDNLKKSVTNRRTRNQDKNHKSTKGDNCQELVCKLYGWEDLNKRYDNYNTPIDCYDPNTGLYYQVRGRNFIEIEERWNFSALEREWDKKYNSMVCICKNKNGNIIERIYIFPSEVIKEMKNINIKNNNISNWVEQYRVTDEDVLKIANKLWKRIIVGRHQTDRNESI